MTAFGIAFGYAHLDSPMATRGFGTYEPWNPSGGADDIGCNGDSAGTGCFSNPGVAPGNFTTNGMKVRADMGSTVRDGFMATLQFEPNDFYSGIIDLYYSTMEQTTMRGASRSTSAAIPVPAATGHSRPVRFGIFGYDDREQHGRRRHDQ